MPVAYRRVTVMKILLVEDEPKTATYLQRGLTEQGFVVDVSGNGEDGLHQALTADYAAIILDIMLPRLDGWTVLAELRRAGRDTPVLILTARDAVPDRVKGLELGADDYLVKPFAFSELLARVRTLLRRAPARRPEVLSLADLAIDVRRHRVTRCRRVSIARSAMERTSGRRAGARRSSVRTRARSSEKAKGLTR